MIGIVTALPQEYAAVRSVFESGRPYVPYIAPGQGAGRSYLLGEVSAAGGGKHQVALTLAYAGNDLAAIRAGLLLQHFPNVRSLIMCGIAGGVPNPAWPDEHVRLGDIVVSDQYGVIQYDFDKEEYDLGLSLRRAGTLGCVDDATRPAGSRARDLF